MKRVLPFIALVALNSCSLGNDHLAKVQIPDAIALADWWEIITPQGELLYRRVLAHSHVNEQPFTRSGGSIPIQPEQEVIVRAQMNPDGYGGQALRGSAAEGFNPVEQKRWVWCPAEDVRLFVVLGHKPRRRGRNNSEFVLTYLKILPLN